MTPRCAQMRWRTMLFILSFAAAHSLIAGGAHKPQTAQSDYRFIENKGQWEKQILFKADIDQGALFLESTGFVYHLKDQTWLKANHDGRAKQTMEDGKEPQTKGHAFKVKFTGGSLTPEVLGEHATDEYYNYFTGNNRSNWVSHASAFTKINYNGLYPGIDLDMYAQGKQMKYDFVVKPKADASQIKLDYEGAERIYLENGQLVVITSIATLREKCPIAYQIINQRKVQVACNFALNNNEVTFNLPKGYNHDYELVIDPQLIFSTYSGSKADNFGYTATFDIEGFLYSGSSVFGVGYPVTLGAYQKGFIGGKGLYKEDLGLDFAITKYDTSCTKLIYATLIGGYGPELPHSIIANAQGELYIYGTTGSKNFPMVNPIQLNFKGGDSVLFVNMGAYYPNGSDMFVCKLSADGSKLLQSTYIGGTKNDGINSLATKPDTINIFCPLTYNYADELRGEIDLDNEGSVYITSCTASPDFPTTASAVQTSFGGGGLDGCIVKFNSDISQIIWSTYLGGAGSDALYSIDFNSANQVYVAGGTTSLNLPVQSTSVQRTFNTGRADGYVAKINISGTQVVASTYWGDKSYDQIYFVELDFRGNVYVFGQAEDAQSYFIKNAAYSVPNSGQFITKFTGDLSSVVWSTSFGTRGGVPNISPTAFLVDVCNKVYLSGWGGAANRHYAIREGVEVRNNSASSTFGLPITRDAYQKTTDSSDFYLMVMEYDASKIYYATFFGGGISHEHVDGGTSRFDRKGKIYQSVCAGCKSSTGLSNSDFPIFPYPGAWSPFNKSKNCNNAVFKFNFDMPIVISEFKYSGCNPIIFKNLSLEQKASTFFWQFGDGKTSTVRNPTHNYARPGNYKVTLVVKDQVTCNLIDSVSRLVYISPLIEGVSASANPTTIYKFKTTTLAAFPNSIDYTYQWIPAEVVKSPKESTTSAKPLDTTTFQVNITDKINNCTYSARVTDDVIYVPCGKPDIFVPNAFTPNQDNENEVLRVEGNNILTINFSIYDRWGERVFRTQDPKHGWDGTYKGRKLDPDVYVYHLEGVCLDEQQFQYKGNITLIRALCGI